MKTYKDFEKIYIGSSDGAMLTVRSGLNLFALMFGEDGSYSAYECFGDDVAVGEHYRKVFRAERSIRIYDDLEMTYANSGYSHDEFSFAEVVECQCRHREKAETYKYVDIYRAGEFGCIIHWNNIEE